MISNKEIELGSFGRIAPTNKKILQTGNRLQATETPFFRKMLHTLVLETEGFQKFKNRTITISKLH
ncbi:hypothetical protein ACIQZI_18810 [Peribacillus sp. NPDC096379]|uniref:hypothetical protein n=1 Tax=Peribacillus sp. NPDC096379 TaxID=3364393 RepID=UPI00380A01F7